MTDWLIDTSANQSKITATFLSCLCSTYRPRIGLCGFSKWQWWSSESKHHLKNIPPSVVIVLIIFWIQHLSLCSLPDNNKQPETKCLHVFLLRIVLFFFFFFFFFDLFSRGRSENKLWCVKKSSSQSPPVLWGSELKPSPLLGPAMYSQILRCRHAPAIQIPV